MQVLSTLWVDKENFHVRISPYSPGGKVSGSLVTASSVEDLKQVSGKDKVILLKGESAREQYGHRGGLRFVHLSKVIHVPEKSAPQCQENSDPF